MNKNESSQEWICSWEEAEKAQLRRDASRSFRDNLIWLEEMTEFAMRLSTAPSIKHPGFPKVLPKG
jgi:hypothetical protein